MRSSRRAAGPKLSIVALTLCAACACVQTSGSQKNATGAAPRERPAGAELVAGYKGWTRVNPQPSVFHMRRITDCAVAVGETPRMMSDDNPHLEKFVNAFVNDAGRRAMLKELRPRFPVGSLIVKEKLAARDSSEPELLTAMY